MSSDGRGRRVVWGHLAFLAFVATVVLAYLIDARSVSLKVNNLLLVQPAALIALVLVLAVLPQAFPRRPADEAPAPERAADTRRERTEVLRVLVLAAAFGVFAIFLETIGFDVATFLFVAVALVICGERKWWAVLAFSAAFTVVVVYGYSLLVPYPFPMRVL